MAGRARETAGREPAATFTATLGDARKLPAADGSRDAVLLDGLYAGWLDDPVFAPIVTQDLADGQHRTPDPVVRPEFFTTAFFHTPEGLAMEVEQAGFTGTAVYGVEGPGWPLRQEWAGQRRREDILFAARAAETEPSLRGVSQHLIAAATRPRP